MDQSYRWRQKLLAVVLYSQQWAQVRRRQLADERKLAQDFKLAKSKWSCSDENANEKENDNDDDDDDDDDGDKKEEDDCNELEPAGDQRVEQQLAQASNSTNSREAERRRNQEEEAEAEANLLESGTLPEIYKWARVYSYFSILVHLLVLVQTMFFISIMDDSNSNSEREGPRQMAGWLQLVNCNSPKIYLTTLIRFKHSLWLSCLGSLVHLCWLGTTAAHLKGRLRFDALTFLLASEEALKMASRLTYKRAWRSMEPSEAAHWQRVHSAMFYETPISADRLLVTPDATKMIMARTAATNMTLTTTTTTGGNKFKLRPNRTKLARLELGQTFLKYFYYSAIVFGAAALTSLAFMIHAFLGQDKSIYAGCALNYLNFYYYIRTLISITLSLVALVDITLAIMCPFLLALLLIKDIIFYWKAIELRMREARTQLVNLNGQLQLPRADFSVGNTNLLRQRSKRFAAGPPAAFDRNQQIEPAVRALLPTSKSKDSKSEIRLIRAKRCELISIETQQQQQQQRQQHKGNNREQLLRHRTNYSCNKKSPRTTNNFSIGLNRQSLVNYLILSPFDSSGLKIELTRSFSTYNSPNNNNNEQLEESYCANNQQLDLIEDQILGLQSMISDFFIQLGRSGHFVSYLIDYYYAFWLSFNVLFALTGLQFRNSLESATIRTLQLSALIILIVFSNRLLLVNRNTAPAYKLLCSLMALDPNSSTKLRWMEMMQFYTAKPPRYAFRMLGTRVYSALTFLQIIAYALTCVFFIESIRPG